jgi:predicted glycosyltransferase
LLEQRGVAAQPIGGAFGAGTARKMAGVFRRALALDRALRRWGRPALVFSSSRSSALAARSLRIPAFVVCDYEHVELRTYRFAGAHIVHPDVIPADVFEAVGFQRSRLHPFDGLKEDVTLGRLDVDATEPWRPTDDPVPLVVVRPPAEEAHYVQPRALELTLRLLDRLAERDDVRLVFSPRHPRQRRYVEERQWRQPPVILDRPVQFVALLKGADLVVTSGGTMAREAAWLGAPAVAIAPNEPGRVDLHLASLGRLALVTTERELDALDLRPPRNDPLPARPELVDDIVAQVLAAVGATIVRSGDVH